LTTGVRTIDEAGEDMPLEPRLKPAIDAALQRLRDGSGENCLSEFSFANLYLFRREHAYRYLPGDHPCIAGRTYDGARHLLPLFPLHEAAPDALAGLLRGHDCFYPLSRDEVGRLDLQHFAVSESRDDADYLYRADNFRHYRGKALAKKRNLMNQLLAGGSVQATDYSPACRADALAVLRQWMVDKGKCDGEADQAACIEALDEAGRLGLEGFVHHVDGRPAGFVLAEEIQPAVFVMRFAKGLDACKGIYQYMFHHFCASFERPVQWLNFEQDLGLANFRRTKQSYQPAALLRKFRVRLAR
jgi:hypothetical protein